MDGDIHKRLVIPASSPAEGDEKAFFDLVGPLLNDCLVTFHYRDRSYCFGSVTEAPVDVLINDDAFFQRVLTQGNLGLAEAYMEDQFEIVHGTLEQFLMALARADVERRARGNLGLISRLPWIRLKNLLRGRRANVRSHYDLGDGLFESFLDGSMAYSCGYLRSEADTLSELQVNKFDRVCRKLRLAPGERLLDIGCGFGGLLIHAARHYGAECVGITDSEHHHRRGRAIVESQGLSDHVDIRLSTHEDLPGMFDKIVSVGMMEHLRRTDYSIYIRNIKRSLRPEGIGLIHCVGCTGHHNQHDPFIQKYIFPGSRRPRLSEIVLVLEKNTLPTLDVENIAPHYAPTLRGWQSNFQRNYPSLDHGKYDETFKRMWEYYLACSIAAATVSDSALFQVLFTNSTRIERMPYHRV